jgi:hypothetical protein
MTPLRIALLMMLLQVGQATRQSNTPALASVEGTVVDRVTRTPLPDIAVEISGIVKNSIEVYFAKTDKTGKFLIRNLPSGVAYWLVASAPQTKDRRYMPVGVWSAWHLRTGLADHASTESTIDRGATRIGSNGHDLGPDCE